jgi:hypothetical protein
MKKIEYQTYLFQEFEMKDRLILVILYIIIAIYGNLCEGRPGGNDKEININPYKGTKIGNVTVFGAMVLTDPDISAVLGRDFHKVPQGVNGSTSQNAEWRIRNGKETASKLPFNVDYWYSLHAPACPNRKNKGNDRGVAFAHFQIWYDFVFQGEKYKNEVQDNDILIILEDDAVIAVKNVEQVLHNELNAMSTDHLFLGWCYGGRGMPMCTHAYALTRAGAKKIVKLFDICYPQAIDAQLKVLYDKGVFTWRKPKPESYRKNVLPGFEDRPNYFTRGIFIQKNGLVSFNHHGFQNNAG